MSPEQIAEVLTKKEGSPCRFVHAVKVIERFKGKVAWDGEVLVFVLNRPPDELCYAWVDPDAKNLVTVLNRPPVESPATAVRAYIAATPTPPASSAPAPIPYHYVSNGEDEAYEAALTHKLQPPKNFPLKN